MLLLHPIPNGSRKVILFDFDGTLSLIRRGWQEVMIRFMVQELQTTKTGESEGELGQVVKEFVTRLTGRQTIYQMIHLAREVEQRGGKPRNPLEYKALYHQRLNDLIGDRIQALRRGDAVADDWLLPGSRQILDRLNGEAVEVYLASGTDSQFVLDEARLLGVDHYFEDRLYGAIDDYRRFSKRQLIEKLLQQKRLLGPELVTFGDGYVEIEETARFGGVAVGVASNENNPIECDDWKQSRLIEAGAHVIIPHFQPVDPLLEMLRI